MRARAAATALLTAALLIAAAPLAAADTPEVTEANAKVSASAAQEVADRDPNVAKERRINGTLTPSPSFNDGEWEVAYFAGDEEVALVIVDSTTGKVRESWTGYQVAWKMARGYPGAFGKKLNAPYVFLPLCALFLIGLVDWRRKWRIANLDIVVLLSFGVSNFFFNNGDIGVSVPLQYPPLLYLLGRCLWIGFRGRGEGIRPVFSAKWLLIGALFLMGFRIGLNMADAGVVDVGYASIVGADRAVEGEQLYGNFPEDVSEGDTYGPVTYYAYVPFEQVWPWSGTWDDVPGAHGAAVAFDILAFLGLLVLGRRLRGPPGGNRLAAILGFGWAAFPYTAYVLESNSNDALVAVFLIGMLAVLARPAARGAMLALATFTKFAPVVLAPMLATLDGWRWRPLLLFSGAFLAVSALVMTQAIIDPGLSTFYDRTLGFQAARDSPFSVWGQAPALAPGRTVILLATGALSVLLAFRPRRKSPVQVAALGAGLIIALQLTAEHWFYLYIVWFFPLALVAMAALTPEPEEEPARSTPPGHRPERRWQLPSPRRLRPRSRSEPASV